MKIKKLISIILILVGLALLIPTTQIDTVRTISGTSVSLFRFDISREGEKVTEFKNSDGQLAFAEDKHFARQVNTLDDKGQVILEQYFDEQDKPVQQPAGHYALQREYDDQGHNIIINYLDENGEKIIITSGYATIKRTYNENNQIETESYYDQEGNPVELSQGQYGVCYSAYDNQNRATEIYYLGPKGENIFLTAGYAMTRKVFNDKGQLLQQTYHDKDGYATDSALGEYGVRYEDYDDLGNARKLIYLDSQGQPAPCSAGYTMVIRTFADDRTVLTERYYDSFGNPVKANGNRYGLLHSDGYITSLDQNGKTEFRLDEFLTQHILVVVLVVLLFLVILRKADNRWEISTLLVISIAGILYMTLFTRENGNQSLQLQLFWSYRQFLQSKFLQGQIMNNILLFMPLGACLQKAYPHKRVLLLVILLSAGIEATQYLGGFGLCELDDVISNSIGGCLGYLLAKIPVRKNSGNNSDTQ